jgi:hypothetical protein
VNLRCQFGGLKPGIDWQEVEEEGLTVLLDFRDEIDPDMRRFKLLWVFSSLYEHIKRWGRRQQPLAITFDEFSAMAHKVVEGVNPLAELLDEFIQQYLRGQNIWLTVSHQSIKQIDDQVRNSLLSLGTYMFGRAATMEEARILADVLFKKDPFRVKHWRKVWGSQPLIGSGGHYANVHEVIDYEPEFMRLEEQQEEAANRIAELGLFQFLCRPALHEGAVSHAVIPVTIENLDRDAETDEYQFPDYERVARFRSALASQAGIPAATILKELESSLPIQRAGRDGHSLRQQPPPQPPAPATTGNGKGEDTAPAQPSHRHHQRRRRIS